MTDSISIVVPLRNESPNVLPLVRQVFTAFRSESRPVELLLVDDGSTDDTWAQMQAAQCEEARVQPLRHPRSAGQSAALWTGFKASRGTLIGTLDGDLQNDPADLPRLFATLSECDMACGVRTIRQDSFIRRVSSNVARMARRAALGVDFADTGCALRAFKRSVLETVPPVNGFHRFMPIFVHGAGAKVIEVPVQHRPRVAGSSKYGVWNRLGRGLWDLVGLRWYLGRQIKERNRGAEAPTGRPT
jgi:dolichol-phosphate mannosyltransferase